MILFLFSFLISILTQHSCFQKFRVIEIDSSISGLNDVLLDLDTSSWTGLKGSCNDLNLFFEGENLEFWVQNGFCGSKHTYIWIQIYLQNGVNSIFAYYNCPSEENALMFIDQTVDYYFIGTLDCEANGYSSLTSDPMLLKGSNNFDIVNGNRNHYHTNVLLNVYEEYDEDISEVTASSSGWYHVSDYSHNHTIDIFETEYNEENEFFPKYFGVNICHFPQRHLNSLLWGSGNEMISFMNEPVGSAFVDLDASFEERYVLVGQNLNGFMGEGDHVHSYGEFQTESTEIGDDNILYGSDYLKSTNRHTHMLSNGETDPVENPEESDPPAYNYVFKYPETNEFILDKSMVLFYGDNEPPFGWIINNDHLERFMRHSSSSPGTTYGCDISSYPCHHTHSIGKISPLYLEESDSSIRSSLGNSYYPSSTHVHQFDGSMNSAAIEYPYVSVKPMMMVDQSQWSVSVMGEYTVCPGGRFFNGNDCQECAIGSYREEGAENLEECESCPDSTTTEETGAASESECECGIGYEGNNIYVCIKCQKNYYKDYFGFGSCSTCGPNFVTTGIGSTDFSDCLCIQGYTLNGNVCNECDPGTFKSSIGNTICLDCDPNKNSEAGASECVCDKGYYELSGVCELCEIGSYKSEIGDSICSHCNPKTTTLSKGSKYVTDCVCTLGFEYVSGDCEECLDGYFKSTIGNTNCSVCTDGYLCTSKIEDKEEFCTVGYYCIDGKKKNCEGGTYNNETNIPVSECFVCPSGFYCNYTTVNPEECEPSYFCPNGTQIPVPCECHGHGDCFSSVSDCHCWENYTSEDCSEFFCWGEKPSGKERDDICNNGYCYGADICLCEDGWIGERCDKFTCNGILPSNKSVCSSKGWCTSVNECECLDGYEGIWCENRIEENDSSIIIIIISAVGGAVLLSLIVIVLIVICCLVCICMKKKGKTKENLNDGLEMLEANDTNSAAFHMHKQFFTIKQNEVKLIKQLGKGGFGEVFLADWEGKNVAIKMFKTIELCSGGTENDFSEFEKELEIISSVSHPNVLQFYGCMLKPPRVGVVLEFCENSDLQDFIEKNPKTLKAHEKINIVLGISSAMRYLHNRSVIHRDIKSKNILLTKGLEAKVCDFGIARVVEQNNKALTRQVGTRTYMAPEVLTSKFYDEKCDVYSFAIVIWELFHEDFEPFKEGKNDSGMNIEYKVAVDPNFRPIISKKVSSTYDSSILNMMKNCWSHDPKNRPPFKNIFELLKKKKKQVIEM